MWIIFGGDGSFLDLKFYIVRCSLKSSTKWTNKIFGVGRTVGVRRSRIEKTRVFNLQFWHFFLHHFSPAPNLEGGKTSKITVFVEELTSYLMKFERARTVEWLWRKLQNTNCHRISSKNRTYQVDEKSLPWLKIFL